MRSGTEVMTTCGRCGSVFATSTAPGGLCPRCLLAFGRDLLTGADRDRSCSPSERAERPGDPRIPGYEILGIVGAGGCGVVYRGRHVDDPDDRTVALKVLADDGGPLADRFVREVGALARLSHPGIVSVLETGSDGGRLWVAMEYVEGLDLRKLLRTGPLSEVQALRITRELCEALSAAHGHGIVHRDIKPENVLLDRDGRVKLVDFGLARMDPARLGDARRMTGSDTAVGTPVYMAPEQIENPRDVDERADVYALGVLLYEMTTGELPLGRFEPPSRLAPIDPRLDDIVWRALDKRPERRFPSARELSTALDRALATARPVHGAPRRLRRLRTARSRRSWLAYLAPVIALVLLVAVGLLFGRRPESTWLAWELGLSIWMLVAVSSIAKARRASARAFALAVLPLVPFAAQLAVPERVLARLEPLLGPASDGQLEALRLAGALGVAAGLMALGCAVAGRRPS